MLNLVKKIFLFLILSLFIGCAVPQAYVIPPTSVYNNLAPLRDNPLTEKENHNSVQLPRSYFDNSSWSGYLQNIKTNETFYVKLTFTKHNIQESTLRLKGEISILDHEHRFIKKYEVILMDKGYSDFIIAPLNNQQSFQNIIFQFTRDSLGHNQILGGAFSLQSLIKSGYKANLFQKEDTESTLIRMKMPGEFYLTLQRNDTYVLPEAYLYPKDPYTKEDLNQLSKNYTPSNDSRIFIQTNQHWFEDMKFMKNDRFLLGRKNIHSIIMQDTYTGQTIKTFATQKGVEIIGVIKSFALHPNQNIVAVSGIWDGPTRQDQTSIKIFDIQTQKIIHSLSGHLDGVNSLSFSEDGKYLFSISVDSRVIMA